jgi:ribonuclease HI
MFYSVANINLFNAKVIVMFIDEIKQLVDDLTLDDVDGVVIYTDGSYDPFTHLTGGGIHGYTYKKEVPKRGLGLGKWKSTESGYTAEGESSVSVVEYIDAVVSLARGTNNTAELNTGIAGLFIAAELGRRGVKNVHFRIDSKYVIEGIKTYVDHWEKNNWLKANGQSPANIEMWQTALKIRKEVEQLGINYDLTWVKGHEGEPGNETADNSADIGRILNDNLVDLSITISKSDSKGYWKVDVTDKISLIAGNLLIFDAVYTTKDCKRFTVYSNEKNDISTYGIPDNSASYGVVELKEPPIYINKVIEHQHNSLSEDLKNSVGTSLYYHLNLRNTFSPSTLALYNRHGVKTLTPSTKYDELRLLKKETPITEILYPVRFAIDGFGLHQSLGIILDQFIEDKFKNNIFFTYIEVTPYVYSMNETAKNKTYKLRPELDSATGRLDLLSHFPELKTDVGLNPLILSFGSDMPRREIVASAAKLNPKAYVVHWNDGGSFKRAFILETDEGIGIWHNPWRSVL